jgi:signal transduction histidine kinase
MSVVLVADDEPALLEVVGDFVEMLGHEVVRAHDGDEALELTRSRRPSLVLTDHMMPKKTGLAVSRELRANPSTEKIPVILMSAVHPKGLDGHDVYLKKPFDLRDLEQLISRALDERPSARTPQIAAPMSSEEMVGWVAHAMKNPLGLAHTQLQMLDRSFGAKISDADRQALGRVQRGVTKALRMIDSLLDASQFADGKATMTLEEADVVALVRQVTRDWISIEPRASFVVHVPDEPVRARFDAEWLGQVIENLLANAIRHGASKEPIEVTVTRAHDHVEIGVSDRGDGIEVELLPLLFQRFRRGEDGRTGHGLGLYIASEVVRLHGGSIEVHSTKRKGAGATFVVKLPLPA